jgi:BirA family biotin operon repressor/biotin-[acetyl-CoA-carboxylase] ligase
MKSVDAGILRALRATTQHVSSAELAETLGIPPQVLTVRLGKLRSAGYEIEEHPHFGCKLISAPDRIIADDLEGMLDGVSLVTKVVVFEKTDSTNNLAVRMGREGAPEGIVIFAEEQTAGRGRLGRRWESDPRRGLWFSVLLRPRFSHALWTRLTTWAAVAIAEAIEAGTTCRTTIKWPNDVYISGKKVAGILIESHFDKSRGGFAVLGVGINVNHDKFPPELADKAVSLRMAADHPFDRQKIAAAVLRSLDAQRAQLEDNFKGIVAAAGERSFLRGKWIQVFDGNRFVEGIAECLDEHGALVMRLADGSAMTISCGEATLSH